ncbi:receptor-like protein EIX2 [Ziziphus jujuba]|uniref:Receptor-like protein EIX2 n=1 Tax=Ziziphus jujuba TaxID=326968 RepID=A0ABM3IPR8_ZIZJJ|nr:receptor-like protein EIX2 [Ziziphus jujuba]
MIKFGSISGGTATYNGDGFVYSFIYPHKLVYQSDAYARFYENNALVVSEEENSSEIPTSLINLTWIEVLNLSYNNLYGRIPSKNQFDTFVNVSYIGNQALYGLQLTKNCPFEATSNQTQQIDDGNNDGDEFKRWFFVGVGIGFYIGFWGMFGSLCLNRSWRHAYFLFKLEDWLLLRLALYIARFQRRFNTNNNQ